MQLARLLGDFGNHDLPVLGLAHPALLDEYGLGDVLVVGDDVSEAVFLVQPAHHLMRVALQDFHHGGLAAAFFVQTGNAD